MIKEGLFPKNMSLRLAILSRGPRLYSTKRLLQEARERELDVSIINPMTLSLFSAGDSLDVTSEGDSFEWDAVIPRIGHSITKHGCSDLRHLDQLGVWCANSAEGIQQSRDKLQASQILSQNKIPIPKTVYVRDPRDVERAIEYCGGLPVVVKVTQGTQGDGVFLRYSFQETKNLVQGLLLSKKAVLIQEYISESHGTDIRALVVGDRVVASMRRRARGREFRSNYHLNGTVEKFEIPPEYEEVACRAARLLGLHIAGVDLLEGEDGPLVLEVNSSPGLEGIEKASGVNVAGEIIDYVINEATFSEVSMDQILRTIPGEGVLSIQVRQHPKLIGNPIQSLFEGLEKLPTYALSRNNEFIWNADGETLLRFDDLVICYGDLKKLRTQLKLAIFKPVSETIEEQKQD